MIIIYFDYNRGEMIGMYRNIYFDSSRGDKHDGSFIIAIHFAMNKLFVDKEMAEDEFFCDLWKLNS